MADLADFVHRGAARITPQILSGVHKKLPLMKVQFAQIAAPNYPHLVAQLQFLANVVEDFVDGKADELPLVTIANACYAIIYARRQWDLIPDYLDDLGRSDDSGIVRVVLIEHERVLANYAQKIGLNWRSIGVEP